MDLNKLEYPEVSDVQIAFGVNLGKDMTQKARDKGFYNDSNGKYNRLFSELFFNGGSLNIKPGLDKEFQTKATRYLKALMGSFEPKHEDKEAVCAMILSELVDIER